MRGGLRTRKTVNRCPHVPARQCGSRNPHAHEFVFAAIPGCWPGRALPTSSCPQPGRTPYARSSGLLPSRARPRPSSPSASAGGKGSLRRQLSSHHTPPATVSQSLHQQPTPSSARQKPRQGCDSPSCNSNPPAPQRAPAGSWQPT